MVTINSSYLTSIQLSGWDTGLYPQAKIYWTGSREIDQSPINLEEIGGGLYSSTDFTPSTSGYYSIQYTIYTDSSHTISSNNYGRAMDVVEVTTTTTSTGGGGSAYISSQLNFISSQVIAISGNMETYGGGGGGTTIYTRGKSPWTYSHRDEIMEDVRSIRDVSLKLSKTIDKYHMEELKEINSTSKIIESRIDNLLNSLHSIKKDLTLLPSKKDYIKILKEINNVIRELGKYKSEVKSLSSKSDFEIMHSEVDKLALMISKLLSSEELEDSYD